MKPDEIGSLLKAARENRDASIADAANTTKISTYHILNIEKGEFTKLGGKPYAIGFIKSYAKYLGLCETHFSELLREHYPEFRRVDLTMYQLSNKK